MWRRACSGDNGCVEVAFHTASGDNGTCVEADEWRAFIAGAKDGQFDY